MLNQTQSARLTGLIARADEATIAGDERRVHELLAEARTQVRLLTQHGEDD